jgi:hypothetical protein
MMSPEMLIKVQRLMVEERLIPSLSDTYQRGNPVLRLAAAEVDNFIWPKYSFFEKKYVYIEDMNKHSYSALSVFENLRSSRIFRLYKLFI